MVRWIREILIDDLDGGEAHETVRFAIDSTSYEIDLHEATAQKLRELLAPFMASARRSSGDTVSRRRRGSDSSTRTLPREKSSDIRTWAKAHGLSVSERGRIAAKVVEQYEAAH
ncbi:histone-like nucleoid-structuring protein Lsr2 [Streptosporangium lutulentum]|uniref:histone-like nucleoid-structuring protein Lsr2 n=1 Tax=Streptosporangium lutulentum TaxID=1461250 RepID=UPI0027D8B7F9|nr:Lsr2 family protein [Streptosporangium lutulentum]